MKILIAYSSSTLNTEKIANALMNNLTDHEVELLLVDFNTESIKLSDYELVLFGSGIYLGVASNYLTDFVQNAIDYPKKFAVFYSCGSKQPCPHAFDTLIEIMSKHSSEYLGEWHCFGEVFYSYSSDDFIEAQKNYEKLGFHPSEQDFESATNFVKSILSNIDANQS